MRRTTIRLPDDLMSRARKRAAEKGRTLTSLIEEGLKALLVEPKRATRKRIRLPISKASGGTLPGVDLNRSADLEDRMGLA
jgi:predicted transcriptional regulator